MAARTDPSSRRTQRCRRAIKGDLPDTYPEGHAQAGEPIDYDAPLAGISLGYVTSSPAVRRLGVLDAAGRGAGWGAAAAGCYALAFGAFLALHTVVNSVAHAATSELGGAPFVVIVAVLVAAVVAVPVGAVCGCVLGMAALPLARAFLPRPAGWTAATVVLLGGLAVFVAVTSGSRGGADALLYFGVLPALMAAGGAYQHTSRLSSRTRRLL